MKTSLDSSSRNLDQYYNEKALQRQRKTAIRWAAGKARKQARDQWPALNCIFSYISANLCSCLLFSPPMCGVVLCGVSDAIAAGAVLRAHLLPGHPCVLFLSANTVTDTDTGTDPSRGGRGPPSPLRSLFLSL